MGRGARTERLIGRLHRMTGMGMCLLFGMWFISGAVMSLSGFPRATEAERLRARAPLETGIALVPPERLGLDPEHGLHLRMLGDRPVYGGSRNGKQLAIWADTGAPVGLLSGTEAAGLLGPAARTIASTAEPDQWTAWYTGSAVLHRVVTGDAGGTEVYVSAETGERVQQSNRQERVLAWIGAIPHWVYFTALRRQRETWRALIIGLSAVGCLVCLTGLWRGVRILRRRDGWLPRSPIKDAALRLHHILGLAFGLLAFTWTFSGMVSLSPFDWNRSGFPSTSQRRAFSGGQLDLSAFTRPPAEALQACAREVEPRELQWVQVAGQPFYLCLEAHAATRLVSGQASVSDAPLHRIPNDLAQRAVAAVLGPNLAAGESFEPDDYLYAPHDTEPLRLPYYRAQRRDITAYVDLHRGALLRVHTPASRLTRWVYHGFHSLDFAWLYRRIALWRAVVLIAMAVGAGLSVSAAWLTVRKWRRRRRRLHGPQTLPAARVPRPHKTRPTGPPVRGRQR